MNRRQIQTIKKYLRDENIVSALQYVIQEELDGKLFRHNIPDLQQAQTAVYKGVIDNAQGHIAEIVEDATAQQQQQTDEAKTREEKAKEELRKATTNKDGSEKKPSGRPKERMKDAKTTNEEEETTEKIQEIDEQQLETTNTREVAGAIGELEDGHIQRLYMEGGIVKSGEGDYIKVEGKMSSATKRAIKDKLGMEGGTEGTWKPSIFNDWLRKNMNSNKAFIIQGLPRPEQNERVLNGLKKNGEVFILKKGTKITSYGVEHEVGNIDISQGEPHASDEEVKEAEEEYFPEKKKTTPTSSHEKPEEFYTQKQETTPSRKKKTPKKVKLVNV